MNSFSQNKSNQEQAISSFLRDYSNGNRKAAQRHY